MFKRSYRWDYLDYICVDQMGNLLRPNFAMEYFAYIIFFAIMPTVLYGSAAVPAGLDGYETHRILCSRRDKNPGELNLPGFLFAKEVSMQWLYLITAGQLETAWAVSLKHSQEFLKIVPSAVTVFGMVASFFFLSMALKQLPLKAAYAIWNGIGMTGTFILGISKSAGHRFREIGSSRLCQNPEAPRS